MPDIHIPPPPPGREICDFCSSPDVQWVYPAREFSMPPHNPRLPSHGSLGGWTACNGCKALIDRGLRDKLTSRAARRIVRKYNLGVPEGFLKQELRPLHDTFWANREGPAQPLEPQ